MSSPASTDWRRQFGIDARKPPTFFTSLEEIDACRPAAPQSHVLRRAFKDLSLDGVLCQDQAPVIYFRQVGRIEPDAVAGLHRTFWQQGVAPILVLIASDEVHVYSGLNEPASPGSVGTQRAGFVETIKRVSDQLRAFILSVESGEYFHAHRKSFDPAQRVDRALLRNLKAVREELDGVPAPRLAAQVLDALLCRLIFTCYLFDRAVIDRDYLREIGIAEAGHLRDILGRKPRTQAKADLYKLFKQLAIDFNGDLFSDDLDAEARHVNGGHFDILDRFFRGTDVRSGQPIFWPPDFSIIPIETVSAIYEHFLKAAGEKEKKEAGAFYTPRFLAELVLDMTLEGVPSLLDKRFLDPACGSGIFLVGLFNRLAEEWKHANPAARYDRQASGLMRLLMENLYGIDSNETACRITAFSLYLAFLDQLKPSDIRQLQRKGKMLPPLVWSPKATRVQGETIRFADFFTDNADLPTKVRFVVGNPPWGSSATSATPAARWCAAHGKPLPDKQLATAFIWKAPEHLETGGVVSFVLPHGTLFNHSRPAILFQKEWFRQHSIERVLNMADYQRFLFEESEAPALVVRYAKEKPTDSGHRIDYWAPKADWAVTQAELIAVLPQDRARVTVREVLDDLNGEDAPQIWKERLWATPRDRRLLDRLFLMPRLRDIVRQSREKDSTKPWLIAEGFQPVGPSDDPEDAKPITLPSKWFIGARSPRLDLVLLKGDCTELPSETVRVRERSNKNTTVFRDPHVLVTEGFRKIAFADFAVSFHDPIRGIHGRDEERDLLIFLAAYLRSPLARYFEFHTSSNWGVGRQKVDVTELLRIPFPRPEQQADPRHAASIVQEAAKIIIRAARDASPDLADRIGIVRNATTAVNPLIEEYFDIDDVERVLIEDTDAIIIPSVRPTRDRVNVPTIIPSSENQWTQYTQVLRDTLNGWASREYQVHARSVADSRLGVGLVVLEKTRRGQPPTPPQEPMAGVMSALQQLQSGAAKRYSTLELVRGLKVFDKNLLYITKPLGQRFWTRTAALNDADEIAGTILMRSARETV
jgi:hypothetical protein